jgi:hypothetical protein
MTDAAALPPGDDALLAELRRVVATADPVPAGWGDAAMSSFAWMSIDALPAQLAYDSRSGHRTNGGGGDGVPSPGAALRELRYTNASLAIELELDVGADKLRVLGRVAPARRAHVVALWPQGSDEAASDDSGTFRFDELPRRPLCVVVTGAHPVKTGWIIT